MYYGTSTRLLRLKSTSYNLENNGLCKVRCFFTRTNISVQWVFINIKLKIPHYLYFILFMWWAKQKVKRPPTDSKLIKGNAHNRGTREDGLPFSLKTFARALHVRNVGLLLFIQERFINLFVNKSKQFKPTLICIM